MPLGVDGQGKSEDPDAWREQHQSGWYLSQNQQELVARVSTQGRRESLGVANGRVLRQYG